MTDPQREACRRPSPLWTSLRACLLLLVGLMLCGSRLSAQALNPGGPVDFGSLPVATGNTSLTLVFNAATTTNISSVTATTVGAANSDFQVPFQNCTGIQAPPSSCIITLSFAPSQIGLRRGALMITDNSGAVVNIVFLHGIGLGPQTVLAPAQTSVINLGVSPLSPTSAVSDGNGNLFFTDLNSGTVYERTPASVNSSAATLALTPASQLAVSGQGFVYISSPGSAQIQVIKPTGPSPTVLSTGSVALVRPTGLAIDGLGYLYIADAGTNTIVRTDLAGSGTATLTLSGLSTPLSNPSGLAVDASNNLYIADTGNNRIVKVSLLTGHAAAVALSGLTLSSPQGVAVDAAGSLTVADTGNARLIDIPASGTPFVLGTPGATLVTPVGLFIQPNGDLMVADTTAGMLLVSRSSLTLTYPTATKVGSTDTTDGPLSATLQNSGNLALQFNTSSSGLSSKAFTADASSTCPTSGSASAPLAVGAVCTYAAVFTPTNTGANSAQLTLTATTAAGAVTLTQNVTLNGNGFSTLDHFIVTASPTPTVPGAPVTITVTAIDNTGAVLTDYLGTITFTSTDATATFPAGLTYAFTAADAGVHTFTAPPAGVRFNTTGTFTVTVADNTHTGTSNPVVVVDPATATLTSSVNPIFIGNSSVLSVSVTAPVGTPTGTVTFLSGTTSLGTATLVNGAATITVPFNTAGTFTLTAAYSGDTSFAATTSNAILENVQTYTPTVTLTSSVNPLIVNNSTMLTVSVTSASGTPTGTITFLSGATPLGTATLVNGTATLHEPFNTPGTFTLTAAYSGDTTFAAGTSNTVLETVQTLTPTVTLTSSVNPLSVNNSTMLTVAVTSSSGTPTGTITFVSGATSLGTATLVNGTATLHQPFNTPGTFTLTAAYSGDTTFTAGTSNTVLETVVNPTATVALVSSANPILAGASTTLTVAVTSTFATPTGTVTFLDGTTPLGTATLASGAASLITSFTTPGTHNLTVSYSGDSTFPATTSNTVLETVEDFSIALAPGASATLTTNPGSPATFQFLVSPLGASTLLSGVTFSATGVPTDADSGFSPANIPAGSGSTPLGFTITPPANHVARLEHQPQHPGSRTLAPIAFAAIFAPLAFFRRRSRLGVTICLALIATAASLGLTGCGLGDTSAGYYSPQPHTYPITITATSGSLTHTVAVNLTVE
jgi:large repetitive protein